jgi:CheY-like chemotaxis protein
MSELRPILLVEDDANDVELTLTALAEHNLANPVVVLRDGAEALDYLYHRGAHAAGNGRVPIVVLLDLKMPKLNGLEVLRQMKTDERLRTVPVVMLTSSREERDLVASYQLGVNAYVVKPVSFQEFVRAIRGLGVFWAVINEPPPGNPPPGTAAQEPAALTS